MHCPLVQGGTAGEVMGTGTARGVVKAPEGVEQGLPLKGLQSTLMGGVPSLALSHPWSLEWLKGTCPISQVVPM